MKYYYYKKIYGFVGTICDVLEIPFPTILFNTSGVFNDMQIACISGNTLVIDGYLDWENSLFFVLAHELRHMWQLKNDAEFYFEEHLPYFLCESMEEYQMQLAEFDANAFATMVMDRLLGLQYLFPELSNEAFFCIYMYAYDLWLDYPELEAEMLERKIS